ncbi:MAG: RNB domain-containing ribonuclease [Patescibacteria group bacterium]|nr:RNB domain-containing ribonuclease [Patescibacteria group bacterium]
MDTKKSYGAYLLTVAKKIMRARGFNPDLPPQTRQQLLELKMHQPQVVPDNDIRDLRDLLWSSIDNDTSRDIDQVEFAERLRDGDIKVSVAIADIDAFVRKNSPIDNYASEEATTVYAGIINFPMLPEELSYNETSLIENADKLSIVIEFTVKTDGTLISGNVYRAVIRNHAQLTYNSVGQWLKNETTNSIKISGSKDLQKQLKLQDEVAQLLNSRRHEHGALYLESIEIQPVLKDEKIIDIINQEKNRATDLIENFMIAANSVVADTLKKTSSLRRVVKTPKRWDRIVQLAADKKYSLPSEPSSKELNNFLIEYKARDPEHFSDLSLSIIKLMGPGEYILEKAGDKEVGHFGLAIQDYTHSTAPNRRFADIVTQRLIKSVLAGEVTPYTDEELIAIAGNCTLKEDAANKVERDMSKRIAAMVMSDRIGNTFDAVVTGVTDHGTFVRTLHPHVEGLLAQGQTGVDVGDTLQVKLIHTDTERGYIDFAKI